MSVEWHYWSLNKRKRIPIAQAKLDNPVKLATLGIQDEDKQNKNTPEKLATQGTQDEDKQNKKNTTQYMLNPTIRKQAKIT